MTREIVTAAFLTFVLVALPLASAQGEIHEMRTASMTLVAVAETPDGALTGVSSRLDVTLQRPGTGRVFVSTQPFTQMDMQGSARLAAQAAEAVSGIPTSDVDLFYTVRAESTSIGGPSAGGAMAIATLALLKEWTLRPDVVITGTINPDASIGPIGGLVQKLEAAGRTGAKVFVVPTGQTLTSAGPGQDIVNITELGKTKWNIDVLEAADLYSAVQIFTGYAIRRPQSNTDPVEDPSYQTAIQSLAANLETGTRQRANAVEQRFSDLDSRPAAGDARRIQAELDAIKQHLDLAGQAVDSGRFYVAASHAFQAAISLERADALVSYFEGDGHSFSAYAADYVSSTRNTVEGVATEAEHAYPVPGRALDTLGAAEIRVREALSSTAQAEALLGAGQSLDALEAAAFARARSASSQEWSSLGSGAGQGGDVLAEEQVKALYAQYESAAALNLQYARLLLGDSQTLAQAQLDHAEAARAAEAGQWEAALFKAIDALSETTTALVTSVPGYPTADRLPTIASTAAFTIQAAKSLKHPAFYATSRFELAEEQEGAAPIEAFTSYTAARLSAQAALDASNRNAEPSTDEYVGFPAGSGSNPVSGVLLALAFAGGAGAALAAGRLAHRAKAKSSIDSGGPTAATGLEQSEQAVPSESFDVAPGRDDSERNAEKGPDQPRWPPGGLRGFAS